MPAERYLIDGKRVPSVSSCKSMLGWGQRGLMHWANTKGLDGLTLEDAYRGGPAEVGTMAHAMIEADLDSSANAHAPAANPPSAAPAEAAEHGGN